MGPVNTNSVKLTKCMTERARHEHELRQSDRHTLRLRGSHTDDSLRIADSSERQVDERDVQAIEEI
jgi:hypothetical protein